MFNLRISILWLLFEGIIFHFHNLLFTLLFFNFYIIFLIINQLKRIILNKKTSLAYDSVNGPDQILFHENIFLKKNYLLKIIVFNLFSLEYF